MSTLEIEGLYNQFKIKAEAVAAQVYRVHDVTKANRLIAQLLKEQNAHQIVISESDLTQQGRLATELRTEGFTVFTTDLRGWSPQADAGISQVDLAVAESGSLAQDATEVATRVVSTLPPIHIALVLTGNLHANLNEALSAFYSTGKVPSYINFITGPSRTSDIERVLTIGVHGPEKLLIVFVDQGGEF
ncbi:MAG: lactate utilization protein [Peptococcaceae bacterium]|nr:lactate utilization protein [Peptococcaceae bacterium]